MMKKIVCNAALVLALTLSGCVSYCSTFTPGKDGAYEVTSMGKGTTTTEWLADGTMKTTINSNETGMIKQVGKIVSDGWKTLVRIISRAPVVVD